MKKLTPISFTGYLGLLLTLIYLFFYLKKVDITLIYFWQQSVPLSFGDSFRIPGGVSKLLADLFLELLHEPVRGSLTIVLLAGILLFSFYQIFKEFRSHPFFYPLLAAALIPYVLQFTHYRLPAGLILSVSTGIVLGMLINLRSSTGLAVSLLINFLAAISIYWIAGVPGLLVFFQLIIIRALLSKRYAEALAIVPVVLLPLVYLLFSHAITIKQAYIGPFLVSVTSEIVTEFFATLASPLLLLLILSILSYVLPERSPNVSLVYTAGGTGLILAALILASQASFEESEKDAYGILKASSQGEWEKVIRLTEQQTSVNKLLQFEANRALYHSGILLEKMFSYPQTFGERGLFLDGIFSSHVAIHTAAFYYDLKFANEARHWATEAQMLLVRHPMVLKQLVMSCVAIGHHQTALKYLEVLSGSRIHRDWCDRIQTMLHNNTEGEHPDINSFRFNNPAIDFFAGVNDPVVKLRNFYLNNRSNHMAFEFLVAGYLLQHNIEAVISLLPEFKIHGYKQLPQAVKEALMIYLAKTERSIPELADYPMDQGTKAKFTDFSLLMGQGKSRAELMTAASKYRNTFWYYIVLSSPYATKK